MTNKIKKKTKKRQQHYEPNFNDLPPWARLIIVLIFCGIFAWDFIIKPFIEWVIQNIVIAIFILIVIVISFIVFFPKYLEYRKKRKIKEAKEKEKLINQVIETIQKFKPARKYKNEFPYQVELVGYLKSKFPHADIEKQKGSSRPDIVINNIAIEIKGPTRTKDLKTIADKCMRYYQHFEELIVVLFEVNVHEPRYEEWKKGMKNTFPNVKIIRK